MNKITSKIFSVLTILFFANFAQAETKASEAPGIESFLFQLAIIFVVFYFLLIRPQQKKYKLHNQMVASLKKGDKVITTSGVFGVVTKAVDNEKFIHIEIADNVEVKILRTNINDLADKPNIATKGEKK
jgi:preprotein translocase subunit YajC